MPNKCIKEGSSTPLYRRKKVGYEEKSGGRDHSSNGSYYRRSMDCRKKEKPWEVEALENQLTKLECGRVDIKGAKTVKDASLSHEIPKPYWRFTDLVHLGTNHKKERRGER